MSKIIFIDVDGTLLDYENKLPQSAVIAIQQARANGHKVYICMDLEIIHTNQYLYNNPF